MLLRLVPRQVVRIEFEPLGFRFVSTDRIRITTALSDIALLLVLFLLLLPLCLSLRFSLRFLLLFLRILAELVTDVLMR